MNGPRSSGYILAGVLISILGAVCFSTKAVVVKLAYLAYPVDAITLLAIRMLFSLPFFLVSAMLTSNKKDNVKFTSKQWLQIAVLGSFGYYISSLLDFEGLKHVSAGIERLILFIYPTFVLLISSVWLKRKVRKIEWIAVTITYAGLVVAFAGEATVLGGPDFYLGSALVLICAVTYAIYVAGSGSLIPVVGAVKFNSYAMSFAAISVLIHFMLKGTQSVLGLPFSIYAYGFFMAIVSTVIPSYLVSISIKRLGANTTAIISSIGPVSTILQAYWLLGDSVSVMEIAGTGFILLGILVISWKRAELDTDKFPDSKITGINP
ncbi:MAG TPA: DMT family transporter [Cyclobacteriaceae bacterium]|nr:DMT family transporter [Cyclobacteriaceae bacterium]